MTGFRATVAVRDPAGCPVASAAADTEARVDSVVRSSPSPEGTVVEEFCVDADAADDLEDDDDLRYVTGDEDELVYRFERDRASDCACELVERSGAPVTSIEAVDGELLLSVRTLELDSIAAIVDDLRERYDGVAVRELSQAHDGSTSDPVVVDRAQLTDRQREVLETAHEMGYFEYPKGANASQVADAIGVSRSTFTEHLAAAQTKLLADLLAD